MYSSQNGQITRGFNVFFVLTNGLINNWVAGYSTRHDAHVTSL